LRSLRCALPVVVLPLRLLLRLLVVAVPATAHAFPSAARTFICVCVLLDYAVAVTNVAFALRVCYTARCRSRYVTFADRRLFCILPIFLLPVPQFYLHRFTLPRSAVRTFCALLHRVHTAMRLVRSFRCRLRWYRSHAFTTFDVPVFWIRLPAARSAIACLRALPRLPHAAMRLVAHCCPQYTRTRPHLPHAFIFCRSFFAPFCRAVAAVRLRGYAGCADAALRPHLRFVPFALRFAGLRSSCAAPPLYHAGLFCTFAD